MSLAEKLAVLTNPTPVFQDPESGDDETSARLTDKDHDVTTEDIDFGSTQLRRNVAPLLEEEDRRYSGKAISRKSLTQFSGESKMDEGSESNEGSESESNEGDESSIEGENETSTTENDDDSDVEIDLEAFRRQLKSTSKSDTSSFRFEEDADYSKYADDSEMETETGDESESDEEGERETGSEDDEEMGDIKQASHKSHAEDDDGGVVNFSSTVVSEEVAKGQAAQAQLNVWDRLLEGRIRLQRCVSLVNQLPQPDTCPLVMAQGGQPVKSAVTESKTALKKLLDKFVELQSLLFLQYPQTQHVLGGKGDGTSSKEADSDDEEITSEEEGETKTKNVDDEAEKEEKLDEMRRDLKRRRAFKDYPEFVAKRHKAFGSFRDATIQKWNDKTRIASGRLNKGFSSFEQSALKQIKQILGDKHRLLERTRVKRTSYDIVGKSTPENESETKDQSDQEDSEQSAEVRVSAQNEEHSHYDAEIFDDCDFYHQMLRELIERKTANVKDPVELSRQWIQMQTLRKRTKRRIDPRARKGRKVRFNIHPKLVNFMAPVDDSHWTDDQRNDLFNSLFGNVNKPEEKTEKSVES